MVPEFKWQGRVQENDFFFTIIINPDKSQKLKPNRCYIKRIFITSMCLKSTWMIKGNTEMEILKPEKWTQNFLCFLFSYFRSYILYHTFLLMLKC